MQGKTCFHYREPCSHCRDPVFITGISLWYKEIWTVLPCTWWTFPCLKMKWSVFSIFALQYDKNNRNSKAILHKRSSPVVLSQSYILSGIEERPLSNLSWLSHFQYASSHPKAHAIIYLTNLFQEICQIIDKDSFRKF